jgi:hypothetical protein
MINIMFTASVAKKRKGNYVASAKTFPIMGKPASTHRGAIKKLKDAILVRMEEAAKAGRLVDLLEDSGYNADLIWFDGTEIESHPYCDHDASVPLARRLALLDRAKRNATGDERNQA